MLPTKVRTPSPDLSFRDALLAALHAAHAKGNVNASGLFLLLPA